MEAGTHSGWISRLLDHEVIVANPRQLLLIAESDSKNDRAERDCPPGSCKTGAALPHPTSFRANSA
jgi:hypothetical protein